MCFQFAFWMKFHQESVISTLLYSKYISKLKKVNTDLVWRYFDNIIAIIDDERKQEQEIELETLIDQIAALNNPKYHMLETAMRDMPWRKVMRGPQLTEFQNIGNFDDDNIKIVNALIDHAMKIINGEWDGESKQQGQTFALLP